MSYKAAPGVLNPKASITLIAAVPASSPATVPAQPRHAIQTIVWETQ